MVQEMYKKIHHFITDELEIHFVNPSIVQFSNFLRGAKQLLKGNSNNYQFPQTRFLSNKFFIEDLELAKFFPLARYLGPQGVRGKDGCNGRDGRNGAKVGEKSGSMDSEKAKKQRKE